MFGPLETPLKYLPGVGPRRSELLARLGLVKVGDALDHFPRRYEDRRNLRPIASAAPGEAQVFHGQIASIGERQLRGGRTLIEARLVEPDAGGAAAFTAGGCLHLAWFNQGYLLELLRPGACLHVYGPVKLRRGRLEMTAPEFELDGDANEAQGSSSPHINRIVPIYPLTKGLNQRFLRGLIHGILEQHIEADAGPYDLFHPGEMNPLEAYRSLHFPGSWEDAGRARSRFVFDEYFCFASHLTFRRQACRSGGGVRFVATAELDRKIRSIFPFRFTAEQDQAVAEITKDLQGDSPMYRLLQGDVGTGKTAVAIYAMLVAVRNGCQAALMAPTELLAQQHHRTVSKALSGHPVRIGLLTSSLRGAERRALYESLEEGTEHIVVGTQAIVQEEVRFKKLALAVIDEQHRFGVRERMRLRTKGSNPHVLVMTATPIPRSLCLTCYGDLDLSILRERPRGRQPVRTYLVSQRQRARAMEFIRKQLAGGRQAYFVYPLIDESETLALPAAVRAHERLSREVFPEHRVGLVHGDLPASQKEEELERFRTGDHRVLVATVVVEVGIDVPNATVLFLEDASRFGLAQLHQLRGRVGRGVHPGFCLVGLESASREVRQRLRAFASTEDGFKIAEEDLKLRGPGDYLGVRQSGRPHFLLGNPLEDLAEFLDVKRRAEEFWSRPEHQAYRRRWASLLGLEPEPGAEPGEGFLGLD